MTPTIFVKLVMYAAALHSDLSMLERHYPIGTVLLGVGTVGSPILLGGLAGNVYLEQQSCSGVPTAYQGLAREEAQGEGGDG
ncbi:uncharacterized protein PG986_013706 [Apiospora aurea]|uniref:Uncharacterized protein n=1 Tax=Apiospora aurea TaxID=335848 RepID=A0ABR1PWD1_9PEZI